MRGGDRGPEEARLRELLSYAVKLTRAPAAVGEEDVAALRAAGLDDRAVHDAAAVTACFNFVNRVALGVERAPGHRRKETMRGGDEG